MEEKDRVILNVDETKVPEDTRDPKQIDLVVTKNRLIHKNRVDFWKPRLEIGKMCWDAFLGNIFTDEEISEFEGKDKVAIQTPSIFPKINLLSGLQRNSRKNGIVVSQGAEDAAPAELVNIILNSLRQQNNLDQERSEAFIRAAVTGFPCFMWLEPSQGEMGEEDINIYCEQWNAVLPDPNFSRMDLSDCGSLIRSRLMTVDQMVYHFPEAEDRIREMDYKMRLGASYAQAMMTSNERADMLTDAQSDQERFESSGLVKVIERLFWHREIKTVYVSPYDIENPFVVPEDWDNARLAEWREQNPGWTGIKKKVNTLWVCTTAGTNVILVNRPHWYQKGEFPCSCYIPGMYNNQPIGMVEMLYDSAKMRAIFETEYVHSIRFAADKLMLVKEGALVDPEAAIEEKARTGGVIEVSARADVNQDIRFVTDQGGNSGYLEGAAIADDNLDRITNLPPIAAGSLESANEPYLSSSRRIQQSMIAQGVMFDNYMQFDTDVHRKILNMLPYTFTKEKVFRYATEMNEPQEVAVNVEAETDPFTLEATKIVNRLDAAKYDYLQAVGDNSITGREHELGMFLKLAGEVLNKLPPEQWSAVLRSLPNTYAQDMAKSLMEEQKRREEAAQSGGPQPEPARIQVQLRGEDLQNPDARAILQAQGVLPQGEGAPAPAQGGPAMPIYPEAPAGGGPTEVIPDEIMQLIAGGQ